MEDGRIIRVKGKGQIKAKPDVTRIMLTLEGTYRDYGETLRSSSQQTEQLKDILAPFGFERCDLKTVSFDVDTEYESFKEKEVYKQRFAGYKFRHCMKLEFDSDNERLGKVLYALAGCPLNPEFCISYTVKDREAVKNELLGRAVKDAKAKAYVLAESAEVKLGEIKSIDYSWAEIDFEVRPMSRAYAAPVALDSRAAGFDMDIEPDDIEVTDTVTVVWEIN